jgi:hypothetical protein
MVDNFLEPRSAPCRSDGYRRADWLCEYAAIAIAMNAAKSPDRDLQQNGAAMRRKVE